MRLACVRASPGVYPCTDLGMRWYPKTLNPKTLKFHQFWGYLVFCPPSGCGQVRAFGALEADAAVAPDGAALGALADALARAGRMDAAERALARATALAEAAGVLRAHQHRHVAYVR